MDSYTEDNIKSMSHLKHTQNVLVNKLGDIDYFIEQVKQNEALRNKALKLPEELRTQLYKPLIIVGPSGVGKSTLINHLTSKYPNSFGFSVSYTTRAPRPGEVHGKNYFYVDKEEFEKMIQQDDFIEHCEVHANFYGTAKSQIAKIQEDKKIPLLDIDIQGTVKFLKAFPHSNTLFMFPPSVADLEARLRGRGTESEEALATRIKNSRDEISQGIDYDSKLIGYRLVNGNLDNSKPLFLSLVEGLYPSELSCKYLLADSKIIFVLGGPASGKGTQCEKIISEFGYTHISTGDLFREEMKSGSKIGDRIKGIIAKGDLVPFQLTVQVLINAMLARPSKTYLIDGFPRSVEQAVYFEKAVMEHHVTLFYDVPQELMLQRCMKRAETSGRSDDNAETIKVRVQNYFDQSLPVVAHFKPTGKVHHIDATGSIDEVYSQTQQALQSLGQ